VRNRQATRSVYTSDAWRSQLSSIIPTEAPVVRLRVLPAPHASARRRLGNVENGCRDKTGSAPGKCMLSIALCASRRTRAGCQRSACLVRLRCDAGYARFHPPTVTVDLHEPLVGTAAAHPSICSLTSEASWQPLIGVRDIASNPGCEPGFKVLPAVNDATPKLAVDKGPFFPNRRSFANVLGTSPKALAASLAVSVLDCCQSWVAHHESAGKVRAERHPKSPIRTE
jgi:hypothetical protein